MLSEITHGITQATELDRTHGVDMEVLTLQSYFVTGCRKEGRRRGGEARRLVLQKASVVTSVPQQQEIFRQITAQISRYEVL